MSVSGVGGPRFEPEPITVSAPRPAAPAAELAARLRPAPPGARVEPMSAARRFWRDFGVNPLAMARRMTVDRSPAPGAPLAGGKRADGLVLDAFRKELAAALGALAPDDGKGLSDGGLRDLERRFTSICAKYGVEVQFKEGAPTAGWGDFPTVEVERTGGGAHEFVHAVQMAVGGVAALSTAAAERVAREKGRPSESEAEIRAAIGRLTPAERAAAFESIVKPMEAQAYAAFERGACGAVGLGGRSVRDVAAFKEALRKNVDAFCEAYLLAAAPRLDLGPVAKVYGEVGHVARTHGETALLFGASGAAYYGLTAAAMAINPALGAVALAPLVYALYKILRG